MISKVLLVAALISFVLGLLKAMGVIDGLDSDALLFAGLSLFTASALA